MNTRNKNPRRGTSRSLVMESLESRRLLDSHGLVELSTAPCIDDVGERSAIVGGNAEIVFTFSDPDEGQTFSAAVDWGDGTMFTNLDSVGRSFTASHTYDVAGEFTPTVWVTDATNQTDRQSFQLTVHPNPAASVGGDAVVGDPEAPAIVEVGDRSSIVGGESVITFEFADPNDGQTFSAAIDWGDGTMFTNLDSVGRSFTASHTYDVAGEYTPTVWVTDATLRTDRVNFLMTVHPNPAAPTGDGGDDAVVGDPEAPSIVEVGDRSSIVGGESVITFEFADPNDGQTFSAAIDWGDGTMFTNLDSVGRSFTASHTYDVAGEYTPTVWVTDATLRTDRVNFLMTVHPNPAAPTGDAAVVGDPEAPSIIEVGDRSSVVGGESIITFEFADPNDGQTFSAAIDWGDGTMFTNLDSVGRSFTASHTYDVAGEYTPTVWVTDATLRTDRVNFLMTVHPATVTDPIIDVNVPLIDPIGERSAVVGGEASLTVTFTDATPGDSHAAAIDWGDGSPFTNFDSVGRSFTATHRYEVAGEYTPTVWVTDSTLRTDRQEFLMVIHPAPATAATAAFASDSDWWLDDEE